MLVGLMPESLAYDAAFHGRSVTSQRSALHHQYVMNNYVTGARPVIMERILFT